MMTVYGFLALTCLLAFCNGFLSKGVHISVTAFGADETAVVEIRLVEYGKFSQMPRRERDAIEEGFEQFSNCEENSELRGKRYMKDGDIGLILLYDANGYIAGIQAGIPKTNVDSYPPDSLKPPFIDDGDKWVITAYFVDPSIICTPGRTEHDFTSDGTGTDLYLQNGTDPEADYMLIPRKEENLGGTKWVKGGCFPAMGVHYWFDISRDMSCDNYFPPFLMYNRGFLNSFGWVFPTRVHSTRYEYPPYFTFGYLSQRFGIVAFFLKAIGMD
ncbi:hypothetical protein ScPMuIL_001687 [Solemya velum]